MRELPGRQIYAYRQCRCPLLKSMHLLPFACLATCLVKHKLTYRYDQSGLLGQWNEFQRGHKATLRVFPSQERLHSIYSAGVEANYGLVVNSELISLNCSSKFVFYPQMFASTSLYSRL